MGRIAHPFLYLALCLPLAVSVSCLGDSSPSQKVDATQDATGTWAGSLTSGASVEMDLNQSLAAITGSATFGDESGTFSGTMDGNRIEATLASLPARLIIATVSDDSMSGTYRDDTANILDNFSATRQ